MPYCTHFPNCRKGSDCSFPHVHVARGARVCPSFGSLGWCDRGLSCSDKHVRECPEFSEKGTCSTSGCRLPHIVRRKPDPAEEDEDVAQPSDEESAATQIENRSIESGPVVSRKRPLVMSISSGGRKRSRYDDIQGNDDFLAFGDDDESTVMDVEDDNEVEDVDSEGLDSYSDDSDFDQAQLLSTVQTVDSD